MPAPLAFLGPIGTPELIIILIVALLLFGRRLPEVMRSLGRSVTEFKRGMNQIAEDVSSEPPPAPKADPKKDEAKTA